MDEPNHIIPATTLNDITLQQTLPPLVKFYLPSPNNSPDHKGRTRDEILSWSDEQLEHCHDYIQTLFPLPERSPITPSAATIDETTFLYFRPNAVLRDQLRGSLVRISKFYGFVAEESVEGDSGSEKDGKESRQLTFERLPENDFFRRARVWVMGYNHNHQRITRIIRCLRVLGCEGDARAFYNAILQVQHDTKAINRKSIMFWTRAMERPLHVAPEHEGEVRGCEGWFLRGY